MSTGRLSRRTFLAYFAGATTAPDVWARAGDAIAPEAPYARVVPGYSLRFPDDEGSHPDFRLEWWYVTGWLAHARNAPRGFQITFFRARPARRTDNPSAFAPHQMLLAHAAVSDPALGRLQHDQRAARAVYGLAGAERGRTDVWIDDWSLRQLGDRYVARIAARTFRLELSFAASRPPMLQGVDGLSRKGPRPESASYYYSLPQLRATGTLARGETMETVSGTAWLDHEWSSSYMDARAVGWDWIGINLDDGGALMAFQMRDRAGGAFWAGGAYRSNDGSAQAFSPEAVRFTPLRRWRSSRTGANYPVSWRIVTAALEIEIEPLFDDQENDTRATTGAIYWEGAVRALRAGVTVGRGYLELTGYWRPLQL